MLILGSKGLSKNNQYLLVTKYFFQEISENVSHTHIDLGV